MSAPIYSNNLPVEGCDPKIEKRVISLLSDATVNHINAEVTFVKHGIYIFIQYKEKGYIINGFSEEVFWDIINGLYCLLHDCGNDVLRLFLQVVRNDGLQITKPFEATDNAKAQKYEDAIQFINDIENMRIVHHHNMKPDGEVAKAKVRKMEKRFREILKNKTGPQNNTEWERCIVWVYNNCKQMQELLDERLNFLQTKATPTQKSCLCTKYYRCLESYFDENMFEIIRDVLRKRRAKFNDKMWIQSLVNDNKLDIANKAIVLIKNSIIRVDPYCAALQAADIILTQKRQI